MDLRLLLFALYILRAAGHSDGPAFRIEPPSQLTFSNTSGTQVSCSAHGSPSPRVDWLLEDGSSITAVPGLRQMLGNGTLYFPPFRSEDYRKEIHFTTYRCRASNSGGSIISRDVHVEAVISQHYDVQVYNTNVLQGNTAVLLCNIPTSMKDYVMVTSWARDNSILLTGSNMGGRIIVTEEIGELHIRGARPEDGVPRYSCLTMHKLTQERKRSAPAILTITEPTGSMPPRISTSMQTVYKGDRETDIHLTCSAQGNPPPIFNWFKEFDGHLEPIIHSTSRIEPLQDILHIRRLQSEDQGRYTCKITNRFGEKTIDVHLTVTAYLSVHILPQLQVVNSGENAIFNCSVSGSPIGKVEWLKDGKVLTNDGNYHIELITNLVLTVKSVTRHDRGMYQCIVRNERESCQGSAELRLGDTIPELQYTFIEQALRPGPLVSLRCSATGSPPPEFKWFLDGESLSDITLTHRFAIGQYVNDAGDVISHLNITNVRVDDGGLYKCRAVNSLGSAEHSARLNIYGPPFVRSVQPVKAVAGSNITMHCPYSGYPISSVHWKRHGQDMPLDLRHGTREGGALTIALVDPNADSDLYTCIVVSRDGEMAQRNIQLIVRSPPILEPFTFPASLQEGGRAQITCYVTSGDSPLHFVWFKDDLPVSASLQIEERVSEYFSMLLFDEVTSSHSGSYTCFATNAAAGANYTANLMVKVSPQWVEQPQDTSVLLGNSLIIDCVAKGHPTPEMAWLKGHSKHDFKPILNSHEMIVLGNGSLYISSVRTVDEGYYLCRASNEIGTGLAKVIYVSVNEPARFVDGFGRNISTKRGSSINLVCEVRGDVPISLIWIFNGIRLDLNTNFRYTLVDLKLDSGLKSQLSITQSDREDNGVYKCQAENAFGRSEYLINLAVQERPDSPNALEVVEIASRSVTLAWRPSFDGNSPLIGYVVQYQVQIPSALTSWNSHGVCNLTLPAPQPIIRDNRESTIITGLQPATAYKIRMLAANSISESSFTDEAIAKTQEEEPSESPKDVHVDAIGSSELFVGWRVPSRDSWNGDLLGYVVYYSTSSGAAMHQLLNLTVHGWGTTKVQLNGLRKFTKYNINVRAFNSVAVGPPSPTIVGITKEGVPEAPPLVVACSQISSQSMKISWKPPHASHHGGLIQGYKVYYKPIPMNGNLDIFSAGEVKRTPSTETYLHGLHKYYNYSIRVLAYTGAGDGVLSDTLFCLTDEDVPGPPASIKAASTTSASILVSWLPPLESNGVIKEYTVFVREAGRVGQHTSYPVALDDKPSLTYEVRGLVENTRYEFWVCASTGVGDGESTPILARTTSLTTPSKIASFSQLLHKPVNSQVLLPCFAVGNPSPRTRWFHRDHAITFSPFYEVTRDGHLNIHRVDQSLAGNYTCNAKNLFGEDEITYSLFVILSPSSPNLEIQYTTTNSIRLQWSHPEDGGTPITGYTLYSKRFTDDWTSMEISPENKMHTFENLQCGTIYHIYILAHNRVGNGSPSSILTVSTKGGPPLLPKDRDIIATNASALQLDLPNWPHGGCPITKVTVEYKAQPDERWHLVGESVATDKITIHDLAPATWYQLRVRAENDAGACKGFFAFATTTLTGARIPSPPSVYGDSESGGIFYQKEAYITTLTLFAIAILVVVGVMLWKNLFKKRREMEREREMVVAEIPPIPPIAQPRRRDKSADRENRRNFRQVYASTTPSELNELSRTNDYDENASGMYEISPYATFNVSGQNSHSVDSASTTMEHSMQFKTFGHIDDDDMDAEPYPSRSAHRNNWRGLAGATETSRSRRPTTARRRQSESDEAGCSPPAIVHAGGIPVPPPPPSSRPRGDLTETKFRAPAGYYTREHACSGYETMLVSDRYRPSDFVAASDADIPEQALKRTSVTGFCSASGR